MQVIVAFSPKENTRDKQKNQPLPSSSSLRTTIEDLVFCKAAWHSRWSMVFSGWLWIWPLLLDVHCKLTQKHVSPKFYTKTKHKNCQITKWWISLFLSLWGAFISFPIKLKYVWCLVHNVCQIIPETSQLPMSSRNLYVMEETRFHTHNGEGACEACGATLNSFQPYCVK